MSDALVARGVTKRFGADGVVDDVDLTVRENEVLLLMGPNGVGKTVFLSCLAGSERPSAGDVSLFGAPLADRRGELLAFLRQETMAIETLTGRENVAFYAGLHPDFTDRWRGHVASFGLEADLDKPVKHYSAGMRRKLELALTLSIDVPLYLLDEPTAGVDLSMIQRFHDAILECYDDGCAFVISSHNPMDAGLADRIAFMPDGTIGAVGTPEELVAGVPAVVCITGTDALDAVGDHVAGGELFPLGGEARGFLAEGSGIDDLRDALAAAGHDGAWVDVIEPTYADMFNYYVHVRR